MIHQYLAALFCSIGLILFAVEIFRDKLRVVAKGFPAFYSLGMLGWVILGCYVDSAGLVVIGVLQFFASLVLLTQSFRRIT